MIAYYVGGTDHHDMVLSFLKLHTQNSGDKSLQFCLAAMQNQQIYVLNHVKPKYT